MLLKLIQLRKRGFSMRLMSDTVLNQLGRLQPHSQLTTTLRVDGYNNEIS
jgi:hypothetical protein